MYYGRCKTTIVLGVVFWAILCAAPGVLFAEILGSTLFTNQTMFPNPGPREGTAHVVFVGGGPGLFEDLVFVPEDVSTVFEATAASDPDFATFAALATNGVPDMLLILGGVHGLGGSGQGKSEQEWFSLGTTDFQSAVIRKVTLELQQLEFDDPNALGGITVRYTFFIQIHGAKAVPVERSTWGAVKAIYGVR